MGYSALLATDERAQGRRRGPDGPRRSARRPGAENGY